MMRIGYIAVTLDREDQFVHIKYEAASWAFSKFNTMAKQPSPIKLVTRTRNKWKKTGKPRSISDNAAAVGYIIWQLALNGAKKLHQEDFRYDDDTQRILVIEEYLIFLVHVSDRITFDDMSPPQRNEFISGVAAATARHLQRNKEDAVGRGTYRDDFLDKLNNRSADYGACSFPDEPGYPMLRVLGSHIQLIMGTDQTNKWVIDQVMDIDAPDLSRQLCKSLDSLLDTS